VTERPAPQPRSDDDRLADHAAIDRLADDLVPALVAKLAASGLGEIEVRDSGWHVRLRMPVGEAASGPARRAGAPVRSSAGGPGVAAGQGTGPGGGAGSAVTEARRATDRTWEALPTAGGLRAPISDPERVPDEHAPRPRAVATSPAVGIYRPREGVAVGGRVRSGDRLGVVDVLGVPHDVLAPADGVVGGSYVEPGEGVEYGQELVRIELAREPARPGEAVAAEPAASPRQAAADGRVVPAEPSR
jgi:acetyl-CoA carboxylase biotin carboxyl carrier protein